jgi:hypothetical protein
MIESDQAVLSDFFGKRAGLKLLIENKKACREAILIRAQKSIQKTHIAALFSILDLPHKLH